jgi:hypothetical protein
MGRRKVVNRSLLTGKAFANFQNAIRSPATQDPYERRLVYFLEWCGTDCQSFVESAQKDALAAETKVMEFLAHEKRRMKTQSIAPSTVANAMKAVRLLLDMNRVSINWKIVRRTMPRMRRYALDRSPTIEEIRAIVDAADVRGKALTLTFVSSGMREGAIETLKVGHVTPIEKDGKIVCAKILVYPGDEDKVHVGRVLPRLSLRGVVDPRDVLLCDPVALHQPGYLPAGSGDVVGYLKVGHQVLYDWRAEYVGLADVDGRYAERLERLRVLPAFHLSPRKDDEVLVGQRGLRPVPPLDGLADHLLDLADHELHLGRLVAACDYANLVALLVLGEEILGLPFLDSG